MFFNPTLISLHRHDKLLFITRVPFADQTVGHCPVKSTGVQVYKTKTFRKLPADRTLTRTSRTVDGYDRFMLHG